MFRDGPCSVTGDCFAAAVSVAAVAKGNAGLARTEVQQLRACGRQHDVARLEVAVHDART